MKKITPRDCLQGRGVGLAGFLIAAIICTGLNDFLSHFQVPVVRAASVHRPRALVTPASTIYHPDPDPNMIYRSPAARWAHQAYWPTVPLAHWTLHPASRVTGGQHETRHIPLTLKRGQNWAAMVLMIQHRFGCNIVAAQRDMFTTVSYQTSVQHSACQISGWTTETRIANVLHVVVIETSWCHINIHIYMHIDIYSKQFPNKSSFFRKF